jgi:triosephosphate isomerase
MKRLIIGNWKMALGYRQSLELAESLVLNQPHRPLLADVVVCPSSVAISSVANILEGTPIFWGAQDAAEPVPGALTGATSLESLAELDCRFILLGHSERRQFFAETDQMINVKLRAVLERTSLKPVVCVGEDLATRQAGQAEKKVSHQLQAALAGIALPADRQLIIAYEPIWAIGTGQSSTPEQAQAMHQFIRQELAQLGYVDSLLLYGGSVKPDNAASLLNMPDIDGLLVGGASLLATSFWEIVFAQ